MQIDPIIQGRRVGQEDLSQIRTLLAEHRSWHRTRLSRELCGLWGWCNEAGQIKDMACRTLLLKLQDRGLIELPARQRASVNGSRNRSPVEVAHDDRPLHTSPSRPRSWLIKRRCKRPEFITPQDGHTKQECEIAASKRWLEQNATRYLDSGPVTLLGDDLYAHQPFCRRALLHGFHFLFTCKPESHSTLYQWVNLLQPGPDLGSMKFPVKVGSQWHTHTCRWANPVPLAEGDGPVKVNWCEVIVGGAAAFHDAWIGNRPLRQSDLTTDSSTAPSGLRPLGV